MSKCFSTDTNIDDLKHMIDKCRRNQDLSNRQIKLNFIQIAKLMMNHVGHQHKIIALNNVNQSKANALDGEVPLMNPEINSDNKPIQKVKAIQISGLKIQLMQQLKKKYIQIDNSFTNRMNQAADKAFLKQLGQSVQHLIIEPKKAIQKLNLQISKINSRVNEIEQKFREFSLKLSKQPGHKEEKENRNKLLDMLGSFEKQMPNPKLQPVDAINWVDPQCSWYESLSFCNQVVSNCNKQSGVDVIGLKQLSNNGNFSIKVINMTKFMRIGIIDVNFKKQKSFEYQQNWIYYCSDRRSKNGKMWKINVGEGFAMGETVTVIANFKEGSVIWKVGQDIRHKEQCPQLKNSGIKWVPQIYLKDSQSTIGIFSP